jgi:protein-L-isoaspartate(D-aspartate) O-methyltransferase
MDMRSVQTDCSADALQVQMNFYARLITAKGGSNDKRLISAFACTPRERFVAPGPWKVFTASGYIDTCTNDPLVLYQDIVVALASERSINNGEPSLHARCLAALGIAEGETAIHVGAGTGYYTALLAKLVGPLGCVFAYEIEPDLAERAAENLRDMENVQVRRDSGVAGQLPACDLIYVSAGASHPCESWLSVLRHGGRLLFPLTDEDGVGGMLLLVRKGADYFVARFISAASFIPCVGVRDDSVARALRKSFKRGGLHAVRSLRLNTPPDATCWVAGSNWWLSTASPA